jgi:hypothetical protein
VCFGDGDNTHEAVVSKLMKDSVRGLQKPVIFRREVSAYV